MHMIRLRDTKPVFEDQLRIPKADFRSGNVAFSPDGKSVAFGDIKGFKIFDLATEKLTFDSPMLYRSVDGWQAPEVSGVRFSADGRILFASTPNGVQRWSRETGKLSPPVRTPWWIVNGSMSCDGRRKCGWYMKQDKLRRQVGQGFTVVDTNSGEPLWQWPRDNRGVDGRAALTSDGRFTAISDYTSRSVYILDLNDLPPSSASQPATAPAKP